MQQRGKGARVSPNAHSVLQIPERRRLRNVAFVFPASSLEAILDYRKHVIFDIMAGISDEFQQAHINLCHCPVETVCGPTFENFKSRLPSFDGAIVVNRIPQELIREFTQREIPCVAVRLVFPVEGIPHVTFARRKAAYLAVDHLARCGYRKIAYMGACRDVLAQMKLLGFLDALREHKLNLDANHHVEVGFNPGEMYAAMGNFVKNGEMPEAVFVDSDLKAMEAIRGLKDGGLSVPEDVAVVGYDDVDGAATFDPPLTTVRVPCWEMGQRAAQILMHWPKDGGVPGGVVLEPELKIRGSTRVIRKRR